MIMEQDNFIKTKGFNSYSQSHVGENRGQSYDNKLFIGRTYANAVWELEKYILDIFLKNKSGDYYLDFACGTGRVAAYLEPRFKFSYGLDISPDMLKIAREKLKKTELIEKDIFSQDASELNNKFDFITAFRFFSNAESGLKKQAIKKMEIMLRHDGFLLFNIHQHSFSFNFLFEEIRRFLTKNKSLRSNWLTVSEIKNLVSGTSLKIEAVYSYSFLPRFSHKFMPFKIWLLIEKVLISKRFLIGSHLLIACKKYE